MFHMEHQLVHPKHSKTFGTNLGCTGNSFRPEFRAGTYKKNWSGSGRNYKKPDRNQNFGIYQEEREFQKPCKKAKLH